MQKDIPIGEYGSSTSTTLFSAGRGKDAKFSPSREDHDSVSSKNKGNDEDEMKWKSSHIIIYMTKLPLGLHATALSRRISLAFVTNPALLEDMAKEALPHRGVGAPFLVLLEVLFQRKQMSAMRHDTVQGGEGFGETHVLVEFAAAGVDVDLAGLEPAGADAGVLVALPEVAGDVEDGDDEDGQEVVEEGLGGLALDAVLEGDVDLRAFRVSKTVQE